MEKPLNEQGLGKTPFADKKGTLMRNTDPMAWMWADACEILKRAEHLQKHFFQIYRSPKSYHCWEPPVDMFEMGDELRVVALLPGVSRDQVSVEIDGASLTILGENPLPVRQRAKILRLEIPYGRFEKRLVLPAYGFQVIHFEFAEGYLQISLAQDR
jgi:HSP20 family protein